MSSSSAITPGASLKAVETFLSGDVGGDRKLMARQNKAGELVLYEKPKSSSFGDRVSAFIDRALGRTERREMRAAKVIEAAVESIIADSKSDFKGDLLTKVSNKLGDRRVAGELKANSASEMLQLARALPKTGGATSEIAGGPTLATLGLSTKDRDDITYLRPDVRDLIVQLGERPKDAAAILAKLGSIVADAFETTNPTAADRDAFALSDGVALTKELGALISAFSGKPAQDAEALSTVFFTAAAAVLPDKVSGTGTTEVKWLDEIGSQRKADLPNIKIGNTEYTPSPTGFLGGGGFANVYEYKAVNDDTKRIALKVTNNFGTMPHPDKAEEYASTVKSAGEEIGYHQKAEGSGHPNVVHMLSHMRLPDGNLAVAMELAPHGNVHSMGKKINDAVKNDALLSDPSTSAADKAKLATGPRLTQQEAWVVHLTMIKDMLEGLNHLHNTQKAYHLDFKSPNCFIGEDGKVKVGDFGNAMKADGDIKLTDNRQKVDNPIYKAPELLRREAELSGIETAAFSRANKVSKKTYDAFGNIIPGKAKNDKLLSALAQNVHSTQTQKIYADAKAAIANLAFDRGVDVWGLGASALEMLTGRGIGQEFSFQSEIGQRVLRFGSGDVASRQPLSSPDKNGNPQKFSIGLKTGVPAIDDLLTQMLHPDPTKRATVAQLLKHPAMTGIAGVDSTKARALVVAMRSGDAKTIADARAELSAEMAAPTGGKTDANTALTPVAEDPEENYFQTLFGTDDSQTPEVDVPADEEADLVEVAQNWQPGEDSMRAMRYMSDRLGLLPDEIDGETQDALVDEARNFDDILADTDILPDLPDLPPLRANELDDLIAELADGKDGLDPSQLDAETAEIDNVLAELDALATGDRTTPEATLDSLINELADSKDGLNPSQVDAETAAIDSVLAELDALADGIRSTPQPTSSPTPRTTDDEGKV